MRELDLAWAAGLFDGEGSTSTLKAQRDKHIYLRASVAQKDRRVLDKFQKIVDCGKVYSQKSRIMHSWDCYRQDEVYSFLELLWPYISEQKREQIFLAKERIKNHYAKTL